MVRLAKLAFLEIFLVSSIFNDRLTLSFSLGTAVINWAIRQGHVSMGSSSFDAHFNGVYKIQDRPSAGRQTTSVDALDSAAFHMCMVGAATSFGYLLKRTLLAIEVK